MFGSIGGLPIHPLVIHIVVILAPLSGLAALAYAIVPRWRRLLLWPTAVGAVVTGVSGVVAAKSGQWLQERVIASVNPTDPNLATHLKALGEHVTAGEQLEKVCVGFMVVVLATVFWAAPPPATGAATGPDRGAAPGPDRGAAPRRGWVETTARVVVVVSSLVLVGLTLRTGHLGATSVWGTLLK